jgi:hypothetical protein
MDYQTFVERARQRAQDERHQARWADNDMTVKSESEPGERWSQHFEILDTGALWMHCDCPSGLFRGHLLVPCKHVTRWGDRMVRESHGAVKFVDGIYWLTAADTSRRSVVISTTIAADLCARRIVDNLRATAQMRDLTTKEHAELERLSEILSRMP